MIRLLIADDHAIVRKGLLAVLADERYGIQVVGEAGNGEQAVELALRLQPEVVLMDMQMPRKSGLEAIQEIKQRWPEARILVLSSFGEDERVAAALKAGALGYLLKDSSPEQMVSAVQAVALGHISLSQELSVALLGGSNKTSPPTHVDPPADGFPAEKMTARELEVLRCLAEGASNKDIAARLSISLPTVRTHVSSILRKLNLENRTQAALYARQQGWGSPPD